MFNVLVTLPDGRQASISGKDRDTFFTKVERAKAKYPEMEIHSDTFKDGRPGGFALAPEAADPLTSAVQGLSQGATFGSGDELSAGLNSAIGFRNHEPAIPTSDTGQVRRSPYEITRDTIRQQNSASQEANPYAYGSGEFIGGAAAALPPFKAAQGMGYGSRAAQMALTGGLEGGLAGLGYSTAETPLGVAADTGVGAGIGLVAAPLLGMGGEALLHGVGAGAGAVKRAFTDNPSEKAGRYIRERLQADGITPESVGEFQASSQGAGRLVDQGDNTRALGEAAAQRDLEARKIAYDTVEDRQLAQQGRLEKAVRDEVDPGWGEFGPYLKKIKDGLKEQAAPLYEAAYEKAARLTPDLSAILNHTSMRPVIQEAMKRMDMKGAGGNIVGTSVQFYDQVARVLSDRIGQARRSGEKELASDLIGIRNRLLREVDEQVPEYAQARATFRGGKAMENAAEEGRNLLTGKKYLEDIQEITQDYSEAEWTSFRIGAVRSILNKMKDAGMTHDATRKITGSTRVQEIIGEIFPDRAALDRFLKTLDVEGAMATTRQNTKFNSRTAMREEEQNLIREGAGMLFDTGTGNKFGLVIRLQRFVGNLFGEKMDRETAREIAKQLYEEIPDAGSVSRLMENSPFTEQLSKVPRGAATTAAFGATPMLIEDNL